MTSLEGHDHQARPLSVQEIAAKADAFEYNSGVPLRYWLRTADTLQKEAHIYERDGNDQQTYFLLLRHALLVLNRLPKHPEATKETFRSALVRAGRTVKEDLSKLEALKPIIENRYHHYLKSVRGSEGDGVRYGGDGVHRSSAEGGTSHVSSDSKTVSPDSTMNGSTKTLRPEKHRDLAIRIHDTETKRRSTARKATRLRGFSDDQGMERMEYELQNDRDLKIGDDGSQYVSADDLYGMIREAGRWRERSSLHEQGREMAAPLEAPQSFPVIYPHVPKNEYFSPSNPKAEPSTSPGHSGLGDRRVLGALDNYQKETRSPPPVPSKLLSVHGPPVPDKIPSQNIRDNDAKFSSASSPSNDLSASSYSFVPSAALEDGTSLRTIFLPPALQKQFLQVAEPNTRRNLETCGFLCGTLISNALFISKLVIPEQESTSDTCEMINESAFFDYCDVEDLMVLGWIHTHPTQTCFMSSRDLHTHAAYQAMMAESIAIVCAPSKDPSLGIFRLTDPPGMKTVLDCRQTGIFHPHVVDNLYTDALKPGHVCELPGLEFEVVDMRTERKSPGLGGL